MRKTIALWFAAGIVGFCIFPWYSVESGFWSFRWLFSEFLSEDAAPALFQALLYGRWWFVPLALAFVGIGLSFALLEDERTRAKALVILSMTGLALLFAQGFAIGRVGPELFIDTLNFGSAAAGQVGFGSGAMITAGALLFILTTSISGLGQGRGDAFIVGSIGLIIALVTTFVFYPVSQILIRAFEASDGGIDIALFFTRFFSSDIWSLACLAGGKTCGPAWNSVFLAVLTGAGTTLLGLAFALVATKTAFPAKKLLRILTIIPIITPPFVIGLALILMFGRAGVVTDVLHDVFDISKSRWLYGFSGIYLAQLLSFTPIAFLVLIGVVEGVSPSMEEASQTLNATQWQTFKNVTWPLMRPGLANAFLLGFIESIADFGNPLVLGGNFNVLSTEIYFAIVGAVADPSRAAVLAVVLLMLTLSAFVAQRLWLGKKSYATVTGKADSGQHSPLNSALKWTCYGFALPWAAFTAVVYSMIVFGSFVKLWGYDNTFTLDHYIRAFSVSFNNGIRWTGVAWDSYFTTLTISTIAAPLTAVVGLLTAYLLVRQKFAGKNLFEFSTMLSFAIPGTVIGVAYIMAFNTPPIELTGTSIILIIVFVFRNMPVGVRGGIAAMSQLDKSLDEASITLGANSFTTVRKVILPLMGPAILAALAYSFVRAITSVSAVIFLVSARHNMATSFIVGRVEHGEYGIAIAYSSVLIITMLVAILLLQVVIGQRKLRRQNRLQTSNKNKELASA
ncbi:iron ABC transporter permease [Pseudovibrio sp. Ad26]|uniref:ABC transporter permease n=1 Tax=Pseudovibrio sp. Ad26 TaxID=989410 RepID=UPI0007AEAF59|nr:iron ABC transporter permease [Pseudovibrio sp. Ad26]KZL13127.1 Molybdenum transport system permease protein ModB [Pseudovibrio sp. Ad26]